MDVASKLNYAKVHVNSISRHDDEDAAVRKAVLMSLRQHIDQEIAAMDQRVQQRAETMLQSVTPNAT